MVHAIEGIYVYSMALFCILLLASKQHILYFICNIIIDYYNLTGLTYLGLEEEISS